MARTVGDAALMFDAQVGLDLRDPLSMPAPTEPYLEAVDNPKAPEAGGVQPGSRRQLPRWRRRSETFALRRRPASVKPASSVEEACPDLNDAREIFHVLRSHSIVTNLAPLMEKHRDKIKPEVVWNLEEGLRLTADEIGRAERKRADLYRRVAEFFETYDMLICPATCTPPIDVNLRALMELEGHTFRQLLRLVHHLLRDYRHQLSRHEYPLRLHQR